MDITSEEVLEILNSEESISWKIDQLLEMGVTKKQLMKLGYKESTCRQRITKFEKEGREVAGSPKPAPSAIPATLKGSETLIPEFMVRDIEEYFDGSEEQRRIFAAGMMVPLMGVRLFAEMVKPLTSLINAMKGDQMEAMGKAAGLGQQQAHNAAMEASELTALKVKALMDEKNVDAAIAGSANPMAARMQKTMAPMMDRMMTMLTNRLMPGMGVQPPLPDGWTKKKE